MRSKPTQKDRILATLIHDDHDHWWIDRDGRRVHAGWYIAALLVVLALSTLPGLN